MAKRKGLQASKKAYDKLILGYGKNNNWDNRKEEVAGQAVRREALRANALERFNRGEYKKFEDTPVEELLVNGRRGFVIPASEMKAEKNKLLAQQRQFIRRTMHVKEKVLEKIVNKVLTKKLKNIDMSRKINSFL